MAYSKLGKYQWCFQKAIDINVCLYYWPNSLSHALQSYQGQMITEEHPTNLLKEETWVPLGAQKMFHDDNIDDFVIDNMAFPGTDR